ncbi:MULTISPECIES: hypothetical protein [Streptomyces]|uniref:Uncharacterized protein n=1 Tax=Streptomyces cinereospinus TaxID=285561 RepID=A0ABV5NAB9_9ACTN|nr:hypothetical protein [Streptomyces sp. GC420]NBM16385.1 hypothetical protein [Streptomyces sp. GC420]
MSLALIVAFLVLAVTVLCAALMAALAGLLHRLDGASLPVAMREAVSAFFIMFATGIAALALLTSWMLR